MGERAKIILNEYTARELIKRPNLDLDKFYSADLKMMIKSAQHEVDKLKSKLSHIKNLIENSAIETYATSDTNTCRKILEVIGDDSNE